MGNLKFRIGEFVQQDKPRRTKIFQDSGGIGGGFGGTSGGPLTTWDPSTNAQENVLIWDEESYGWDDTIWAGPNDILRMPLNGNTDLLRGQGTPLFTRASTTTRINSDGNVESLAIDVAPFDWMAGPSGNSRYCYRADAGLLKTPLERNIYRREGGISFWFQRPWANADATDRYFFSSSGGVGTPGWRLNRASASSLAIGSVSGDPSGFSFQALQSLTPAAINTWALMVMGWSRTNNRIRLWLNTGASQYEVVTSGRYWQLNDFMNIGSNHNGTIWFGGYMVDFRIWASEPTNKLVDNLYLIKA